MSVFDRLREIIIEVSMSRRRRSMRIKPQAITAVATFDDLRMDLLEMIEFVNRLEEEFVVEIDERATKRFRTIGDVIGWLKQNADIRSDLVETAAVAA